MIMKQIIPFKKELPFKTKVSDITSISLERKIEILDSGIITGTFYITGDYKMNEGSINRDDFSFELPFDITLDPRYDTATVKSDIEDFYYDIINNDTLKVNIDLFVEAEYKEDEKEEVISDSNLEDREGDKEDITEDKNAIEEEKEEDSSSSGEDEDSTKLDRTSNNVAIEDTRGVDNKIEVEDSVDRDDSLVGDLFSNLDDTESYTTYYVYVVKEEDTIDKIISLYGVTKEDIGSYNDITNITPGDKIIIPKMNDL